MDLSFSSDTFPRGASTPKQPSNSSSYISGNGQRLHIAQALQQQHQAQSQQWFYGQPSQQSIPNFMSISGRSNTTTHLTPQGSVMNFAPTVGEHAPLSFSSHQIPHGLGSGQENAIFGENNPNPMFAQVSSPPHMLPHPYGLPQPTLMAQQMTPATSMHSAPGAFQESHYLTAGPSLQQPYHVMYAVPNVAVPTAPTQYAPPGAYMPMPHVTALPSEATPKSASVAPQRPLADVRQWGFAVCDPQHSFLQRVPIPFAVCAPTKGLLTYDNDVQSSSTKPCASTVCVAYSQGTCPFGSACPHFHVDKNYLEKARAVQEPLCCAFHNDYFSQEIIANHAHPTLLNHTYALLQEDRSTFELSPAFFAFTVGLDHLPVKGKGPTACRHVNVKKHVCRLHLEGKCKWTKDCSRIHICREMFQYLMTSSRPELINTLLSPTFLRDAAQRLLPYQSLLRTPAMLPIVSMLLDGLAPNTAAVKGVAIEALVSVGCIFSHEQARAIQQWFGIEVPMNQQVYVKPMLRRFFDFRANVLPSTNSRSLQFSMANSSGMGINDASQKANGCVADLYSSPLEEDDIFAPIV